MHIWLDAKQLAFITCNTISATKSTLNGWMYCHCLLTRKKHVKLLTKDLIKNVFHFSLSLVLDEIYTCTLRMVASKYKSEMENSVRMCVCAQSSEHKMIKPKNRFLSLHYQTHLNTHKWHSSLLLQVSLPYKLFFDKFFAFLSLFLSFFHFCYSIEIFIIWITV